MREKYISNIIPKEKLTVFRPCALYGQGETSFNYGINQFIKTAVERRKFFLFGNGEEKRDHILVNDFVKIIYESFQNNITGLFNVASGKSKSFNEVVILINKVFNNSIEIECKPRKNDINHRSFNVIKIKNKFKLDIKNIEEGITHMIESLKLK
jgi:nucleoside-diphosphate-sugar epimerase